MFKRRLNFRKFISLAQISKKRCQSEKKSEIKPHLATERQTFCNPKNILKYKVFEDSM